MAASWMEAFWVGASEDSISKYGSLHQLNSGAYGEVVRAQDSTGKKVAIKRIADCFKDAREALHAGMYSRTTQGPHISALLLTSRL